MRSEWSLLPALAGRHWGEITPPDGGRSTPGSPASVHGIRAPAAEIEVEGWHMNTNEWIERIGDRVDDRELGLPPGTLDAAAELGVARRVDPGNTADVWLLIDKIAASQILGTPGDFGYFRVRGGFLPRIP